MLNHEVNPERPLLRTISSPYYSVQPDPELGTKRAWPLKRLTSGLAVFALLAGLAVLSLNSTQASLLSVPLAAPNVFVPQTRSKTTRSSATKLVPRAVPDSDHHQVPQVTEGPKGTSELPKGRNVARTLELSNHGVSQNEAVGEVQLPVGWGWILMVLSLALAGWYRLWNQPRMNGQPLALMSVSSSEESWSADAREAMAKRMQGPPTDELSKESFAAHHLPGQPYSTPMRRGVKGFLPRVIYNPQVYCNEEECSVLEGELSFEKAGSHAQLHFNPAETTIGIVTCGGLCPGLNDVVRALTLFSLENYNVKKVIGFRYGYMGLVNNEYVELDAKNVQDINREAGSMLGSARGYSPDKNVDAMIETLEKLGINILFTLGGDGTQRGALYLATELVKRGKDIAVVGVPKTIDNDVAYVQRTFGFQTAVEQAAAVLLAATYESRSAMYGLTIVKLMGRHAGFITAQAAVAFGGCHIVLIPEEPLSLETIFERVDENFRRRTHCVLVVAEGFGQDLFTDLGTDKSGNPILGDIGVYLKEKINEHMKKSYEEFSVRYIDPSYIVRSQVAATNDAAFCLQLGHHAVHEAMRGTTGCIIGFWNDNFTVVPTSLATRSSRRVELDSGLWRAVQEITVTPRAENLPSLAEGMPTLPSDDTPVAITSLASGMQGPEGEDLIGESFDVTRLPGTPYSSPLAGSAEAYLPRLLYNTKVFCDEDSCDIVDAELSFMKAGPHADLHFNPAETTVGIVTCGGLCPGLNDVVRAVTLFSLEAYGVKRVVGFRYGYLGLCKGQYMELDSNSVQDIHRAGGSLLGSARGYSPDKNLDAMIEKLEHLGVNLLFCIGGDGTQRGALALATEITKQGKDIGVVGIPKTIDNDIAFVQRTFGFQTAVERAVKVLIAAEFEARSSKNGLTVVKLMGRSAGFITAQAAVAFGGCHIVLIPEKPVDLETIYALIDENFRRREYCVLVVAEGFGQDLFEDLGTDKSGNPILGDIGVLLKNKITQYMGQNYDEYTVRYIDPSYIVRSHVAGTNDAGFCLQLGNHAVHEGLHGSTGCIVGFWNEEFTVVPTALAVKKSRQVELTSDLWRAVKETTVTLPPPWVSID